MSESGTYTDYSPECEEIRQKLKLYRPKMIAEKSGVDIRWLFRFLRAEPKKPDYASVQKLKDFLRDAHLDPLNM